ncbi:MAG: lysine--tRNA ligase [Desulfobacca sp.]|uniref:lysine--tRNA ligase n=1 Tax=Desulfobacca sp. TaxID=2067990 RepID=UPI004049DE3D
MQDEPTIIRQRREKIRALRAAGIEPFANTFRPTHRVADLVATYGHLSQEELANRTETFRLAGRLMLMRQFGKATFFHFQDDSGRLQGYIQRQEVGPEAYTLFKQLDLGDIIGLNGRLFRTKTQELTLAVQNFVLVTKAIQPLPEKYHGLTDVELRYRRRYVDLMVNPEVRDVFRRRSRIIRFLREFMDQQGFLEVETPMMQPIPGGATARPFQTYHNVLAMPLYLRIAPELYLKRLLVGGFQRVFEINRNFRNEGISTQHNPEFTMMEFYQAYADYEDLMQLIEAMCAALARELHGSGKILYQGQEIDLTPPWRRLAMAQSLTEVGGIPAEIVQDREALIRLALEQGVTLRPGEGYGRAMAKLFDLHVEPKLSQPTFITGFPIEISPLSRRNEHDPEVADRFELFIAGREIANGFSELNDPEDQRQRFLKQVAARDAGNEEAHFMDEDFLLALEYGMPPAAGAGIGIDRLVMLLTDAPSIRDVILFPQLRPEG